MERQPISQEGYDKLREEIRHMEEVEMPQIVEAIATARAEGDLSENAEYHGQRENQGHLQARINMKKTQLANSYIVDTSKQQKGVVGYGSTVTVREVGDDMDEVYQLVGSGEEDYNGDIMKILTTSPMAEAMMGLKVGDQFDVEIPAGNLKMEIVEIVDP